VNTGLAACNAQLTLENAGFSATQNMYTDMNKRLCGQNANLQTQNQSLQIHLQSAVPLNVLKVLQAGSAQPLLNAIRTMHAGPSAMNTVPGQDLSAATAGLEVTLLDSVADVGAFLTSINLGAHAAKFEAEAVGGTKLRLLLGEFRNLPLSWGVSALDIAVLGSEMKKRELL
jgi:hypothetical protein